MIRDRLRRVIGRGAPDNHIPFDMFDREYTEQQAAAARKLERIYHKGQDKAWDGKDILAELVAKHGKPDLPPEQRDALRNIFAIILWGELAAWKVSAALAERIEPLEAKLAATSQAHDEARHFYVMHDYLALLGDVPHTIPPVAAKLLHEVITTDNLAKKLVGMQLMVEPIALTLFHMVRQSNLDPLLADLLAYFERDEARHVALGVNYLPDLLREMNTLQAIDYWGFQARMFWLEARGLKDLEKDFKALGFPPRQVFRLGQGKQLHAAQLLCDALGYELPMLRFFRAGFDFVVVSQFPLEGEPTDPLSRLRAGWHAVMNNEAVATEFIGDEAAVPA